MVKGSLNDWRTAMINHNLQGLEESFHFDRSQDDERIVEFNLPHWDLYRETFSDFHKDNSNFKNFLQKYNRFIIRLTPKKGIKELPRFYSLNIYSLDDCKKFLKKIITESEKFKENHNKYDIALAEYEPATYGGIILSNSEQVIIETLREYHYKNRKTRLRGLVGICEEENPDLSFKLDLTKIGHIEDKIYFKSKVNQKETKRQLSITRKALKYLDISRDTFNPLFLRGYFEFVHTKNSGIKFWDYKINKPFLK